jgi:hypothetical protein
MPSCAQNQSNLPPQEHSERFNRARDLFGDCVQRWEDWLALLRMSKVECVTQGRAALVYHFRIRTEGIEPEMIGPSAKRGLGNEGRHFDDFLIVLNANAYDSYHRNIGNQQFVLVDNICLFDGPKGKVPLTVGLYHISDELMHDCRNLSLFESTIDLTYKVLPGVLNWEARVFGLAFSGGDNLKPQDIESTSKVVVNIANDQSSFIPEFFLRFVNRNQEFCIDVPRFTFDNFNGVQSRSKGLHEGAEFRDVLFGPFDFESRSAK